MIEPFAIWNLIQNALAAAETTPKKAATDGETKAETAQNSNSENTSQEQEQKDDTPAAQNACESYLLRHEQLSRKHNNGR
ncbi:MAG: hypothetical protein IJY34_02350 [Clostridia bacterium]|nr:hypothetical protein [Clostridia bacterium]